MRFLAPILLLLFVSFVNAQEVTCRYDGSQLEMNVCAVRDFRTADIALNLRYREVMSLLTPRQQRVLRQQQRTWLRNRDRYCMAQARDSEGGSIWTIEFFGCLEDITEQRTQELSRYLRKAVIQ